MNLKFSKTCLTVFTAACSSIAFSQVTTAGIQGKVTDKDNFPVEGALIEILHVPSGKVYKTESKANGIYFVKELLAGGPYKITVVDDRYPQKVMNNVFLKQGVSSKFDLQLTETVDLDEIVVVGSGVIDLVKDRQTPIAVSTISSAEIIEKAGNAEFPELMKNTPSVQVAGQAGGYGDARINIRGFKQDNTAYLLNGQPINGMEDGKVYWSNWAGMSDIANTIQIQRGLGSSKLAISSVGGTVNIITKATEKKQGGFIRTTLGNNHFTKTTVGYNTGMLDGNVGVSAMFTYWQGDGYNFGTKGQGQTYFLSVGWKPSEKHLFNFLVTGAPQWHDQNFAKPISDYLKYGKRYNNNWGYLQGEYFSIRRNYYHKPIMNLNWDWSISDKSTLSTVLYASWGRGGGTGAIGRYDYTPEGLIDFDKAYKENLAINGNGTYKKGLLRRANANNHQWYGIVSNFEHKLDNNWTFNMGVDLRSYTGLHFQQINDFLGLKGYDDSSPKRAAGANVVTKSYSANPWEALTKFAPEDQRTAWDYNETIQYGGVFGQVEYNSEHISSYFQGAISVQSHERNDRYQYLKDKQKSEKVTNNGFNVKTGLNYKINRNHSIFGNVGYYSRQPYHDNIYLNYGNEVNPLTQNEKILGIEAGYAYTSYPFSLNLNLYRTSWKDRVTTRSSVDRATKQLQHTNTSGLSQLHQGVELDFKLRASRFLTLKGFGSYGHWVYNDKALEKVFDENFNLLKEEEKDLTGGKVGDSPQVQVGVGVVVKPVDRLKFDIDWKYNDELYADVVAKDNLKLPSYNLFDLGVSYEQPIRAKMKVNLRLNINNVLNTEYISETRGRIYHVDKTTQETYKGLDVRNNVFFGYGRTFNVSATLKF